MNGLMDPEPEWKECIYLEIASRALLDSSTWL